MIYFIQAENYVKVGYTSNLRSRYKKYVTENPNAVKLLAQCKGGFDIEKKAHTRMKPWHHRGEWFHLNDESRAMIRLIIHENADNIEPTVTRVRRDKRKHLKTLEYLKEYMTGDGMLVILPHIRTEVCRQVEISTSTFTRHLTKLIKVKRLAHIDGLYWIL